MRKSVHNFEWRSHDRIMISSVANLERLSFRNQTQKTRMVAQ